MARVLRHDLAQMGKVKHLPTGGIRAEAVLAGPSVLVYQRADGTEWREYRPAEVTFHADVLASIDGAPVTDLHPSEGRVTSDNYQRLAHGHVQNPRRDGDNLASDMVIHSKSLIDKLGQQHDVSLGYFAEVVEESGVTPTGERYDAVQRHIEVNHVAVVPRGRSKGARIRLDADGNTVPETCAKVDTTMPDNIKAERDDALEKLGEIKKELETLRAEKDQIQARADAQAEELKTLPAKAREMASLIALASTHEVEVREDMDADAIRDAVLVKVVPGIDLSDKSADYKRARLDAALEAKPSNAGDVRTAVHKSRDDSAAPTDPRPSWEIRADAIERDRRKAKAASVETVLSNPHSRGY